MRNFLARIGFFRVSGSPTAPSEPSPTFFGRSRPFLLIVVLALFAAGLALRLTNLTAPPFDVQAWRQLRSASIARGMYYDLNPSVTPDLRGQAHYLSVVYGPLEPPVFERLV